MRIEKKRPGNPMAATILGLCSCALAAVLLIGIVRWSGNPTKKGGAEKLNYAIGQKYDMLMTNQVSDALDGVLAVDKVYWIGRDEMVAPKPNPECYGEADSAADLAWLLEDPRALKLLDGQKMYFSTETKLQPGTKVRYYLDDTILAIVWKEGRDYGSYTYAEVKIAHPSQFRRFLANGEFGSDKLFITTEMAASVNAVVASSGDFYRFRQAGVLVYDGIVRRVNNWLVDTCYIDNNGDMLFTDSHTSMTPEEAQQFVDDNDINFSVAFGPILIRDEKLVIPGAYSLGEINEEYSRSALLQMDKLHYIVMTVNTEGQFAYVPTLYRFAYNVQLTGCKQAYTLDGGQTAVIAMNDELINSVMYGYQRKISDIIYFATAIPDGG